MKHYQQYQKVIFTAIVTITIIVFIGTQLRNCDSVKNADSIRVKSASVNCDNNISDAIVEVHNYCNNRVSFYRIVVTITDQNGDKSLFEMKNNAGILANESITHKISTARFNCDSVAITASIYPF